MNTLYSLEDRIFGSLGRLLGGGFLTTLARLVFFATLATFFWASAMTKLGQGFEGIFSPSVGAYAQILPAQMEAVGYDPSQLGIIAWLVVLAGMWAEFLIPALIVVGLFTRTASVAMIGFIVVVSIVDVVGHGAGATTIGVWFDNVPDAKILDQRLIWILLLLVPLTRGAGPISIDAIFGRGRA